ncbi:ammonium transporter Rh type B-like [Penaeus chinensis]|uniref:ammonium transporter Rh type B-like n=1 Tax=Penaeus chinensis TaxID=139456 RepID=UPI001FB5E895|nr:ammonium transporter Rh type B-like [Penaeus chinensis]
MKNSHSHGVIVAVLQVIFFVLFIIFAKYHPDADARQNPLVNGTKLENKLSKYHSNADSPDTTYETNWSHTKLYPLFQDVHVMIFIGFGFLMTFLKKYGFSSVGINFLVGATCLQWALLVNGFFHLHYNTIIIDLNALLAADFTAAAVLISFGAVLGKTTPTQLIIMALIEIPIFVINEVIGRQYLGAIDMGDSMFVHAFGAYFGLAVSFVLYREDHSTEKEGSSYRSDLFAMIGTVFLWLYWPSFNGGAAPGDDQHRAVINTYMALCSCTLTTFAISSLVDKEKKFNMVHIQNSTLAGGVAVGTAADLMIHPWGAVLIGMLAGTISVLGYTYLTPFLASRLRIHDTCGVHNLHGMPAILAAIVGCIAAALASEETYGPSLYEIFPNRVPAADTEDFLRLQTSLPDLEAGPGYSAGGQAGNQILALLITLVIAVVGGVITGFLLRPEIWGRLRTDDLYEDEKYWIIEGEEEEHQMSSVHIPMTSPADNGTSK